MCFNERPMKEALMMNGCLSSTSLRTSKTTLASCEPREKGSLADHTNNDEAKPESPKRAECNLCSPQLIKLSFRCCTHSIKRKASNNNSHPFEPGSVHGKCCFSLEGCTPVPDKQLHRESGQTHRSVITNMFFTYCESCELRRLFSSQPTLRW